MTESYFNRLAAEGYNRIPVTLETFADLDTPLRPTAGGEDEAGNLYVTHATANYGGNVDPAQNEKGGRRR